LPDYRCPRGTSPGRLNAVYGSVHYCWLMRRQLMSQPSAAATPVRLAPQGFQIEDAAQAHALLRLACGGDSRVPDYPAWLLSWQRDPEFDPTLCFVVRDDAGLIGFIQGWTSAYIKDLVIHPRARRQGHGLALLEQVFEAFTRRNEAWVDLKVLEHNLSARRLYEKAGMVYLQRIKAGPL
jgi:ribosomal protein S18 acetylase RimI-like enzyme